jgi:hypothetical protein
MNIWLEKEGSEIESSDDDDYVSDLDDKFFLFPCDDEFLKN